MTPSWKGGRCGNCSRRVGRNREDTRTASWRRDGWYSSLVRSAGKNRNVSGARFRRPGAPVPEEYPRGAGRSRRRRRARRPHDLVYHRPRGVPCQPGGYWPGLPRVDGTAFPGYDHGRGPGAHRVRGQGRGRDHRRGSERPTPSGGSRMTMGLRTARTIPEPGAVTKVTNVIWRRVAKGRNGRRSGKLERCGRT